MFSQLLILWDDCTFKSIKDKTKSQSKQSVNASDIVSMLVWIHVECVCQQLDNNCKQCNKIYSTYHQSNHTLNYCWVNIDAQYTCYLWNRGINNDWYLLVSSSIPKLSKRLNISIKNCSNINKWFLWCIIAIIVCETMNYHIKNIEVSTKQILSTSIAIVCKLRIASVGAELWRISCNQP